MTRIGGIILCGGQSRRMGQPKEWLPFGNEVLLQRVVRIVRSVVSPVVVVAEPSRDVPILANEVRLVRDTAEYRGPLQGLVNGLSALSDEIDAVYLSACDVPLLRAAFIQRLIERMGSADIVVPEVEGFRQPLAALYRVNVLASAENLLQQNRFRLLDLQEAHQTVIVQRHDFVDVDPELESLRNLNTPEEYRAALEQFRNPTSTA
jgi:molybdopterin-guanine dinucleotide biosynthesis protein A